MKVIPEKKIKKNFPADPEEERSAGEI